MNCARCGKPVLLHPVEWQGNVYGSTCAKAVGATAKPHRVEHVAKPDERQAELFPSLWQRMKARCVEVFSALGEPWVNV